jgi:hypothetical protein
MVGATIVWMYLILIKVIQIIKQPPMMTITTAQKKDNPLWLGIMFMLLAWVLEGIAFILYIIKSHK